MDLAIHEKTCSEVASESPVAAIIREESAVVDGMIRNDAASWRTFAGRYKPMMMRVIGAIVRRSSASTEDTHDIYGRLMCALVANDKRRLRSFDPSRARLGGYLVMLAEHAAIDHLRAERRHGLTGTPLDENRVSHTEAHGDSAHDPFSVCVHRERMVTIQRKAAKELTRCEQAFFAAYMDGLTPEQIAKRLGIACMSTVYTRKHKILAKIAAIIATYDDV
jgi:RNA polymerase sigma factor (sigma-70 family)